MSGGGNQRRGGQFVGLSLRGLSVPNGCFFVGRPDGFFDFGKPTVAHLWLNATQTTPMSKLCLPFFMLWVQISKICKMVFLILVFWLNFFT